MKKLTCRDLGGPCDAEITGNSFEDVGRKSHDHVMERINRGDEAHRAAAAKMKNSSPEEQKSLMAEFKKRYDETPNI